MLTHIVAIFLTLFATVQEEQPRPAAASGWTMTQREAVEMALERSPELQVSVEQLRAVRTLIQQAREFPVTSFEFDFDQQEELLRSGEAYFGFSQEFEYPTRRGLRIRLARQDVETAEVEHSLVRWETALTVKMLYQRLALAQRLVTLAGENLRISEEMLHIAREKHEAGSVGRLEVLRAGVEAATSANELRAQEQDERRVRMRVNYLLGRLPDVELITTPYRRGRPPEASLEELKAAAWRSRLELRSLGSRQTAATLQRSLARSELYPDFSVGFSRHHLAGEPDTWDLVVGISIPIFGRAAVNGRIAEAEAIGRSLDAAEEAARCRIAMEIESAFAEMLILAERATRFRDEILVQAAEAFRLAQISYLEGEIGNLELLESQRTLQETTLSYAQAVFEYNLALIDLERAVGAVIDWETSEPEAGSGF